MEEGCADSAGSSRSKAASTASRSSSKKGESFIVKRKERLAGRTASRFALPLRIERLGRKLSVSFLEEDFHPPFRLFELFLAFPRERDALFKQLHRIIQRKLRAFQSPHDFFQPRKRALEVGLLGRFRLFGCRCVHKQTFVLEFSNQLFLAAAAPIG